MTPATNEDLSRLIARIANADKQAFATLYQTLEKPIYRFIQTKLNDPFLAADILHDVFLEVWRGAARIFRTNRRLKLGSLRLLTASRWMCSGKNGRLVGEDEIPEQVDGSPNAMQCLIAAQRKRSWCGIVCRR